MSLPLRGFKPPRRRPRCPQPSPQLCCWRVGAGLQSSAVAPVHLPVRGAAPGLFVAPLSWVWSWTDGHSLSRLWSLLCGFASSHRPELTKVMCVEAYPVSTGCQCYSGLLLPGLADVWPPSSPVFLSLNHVCSQETKDSLEECSCPLFI